MAVLLASNWPDLLEVDWRVVYQNQYKELPMMIPDLFNVQTSDKAYEKSTQVGSVPDHQEFTGRIATIEPVQGYDKQFVFTEYAAQIQIQRRLVSDDQTRTIERLPKELAKSANRSREKLGVSAFNLAFTYEPTDGDGCELCASDHPSPVSGIATQSNEGTLALGAGSIETVRLAISDFFDDQGNQISNTMDTILIPEALEQTGWEIINSKGKVDTAENNANFHQGKYKLIMWKRLTSSRNWFGIIYEGMKDYLLWFNKEPIQFFQDKDSDTLVAKYLSYYRCGTGWDDWKWLYGNLVD